MKVCSAEIHAAMKRDARWALLPLKGHSHLEADEFGPAETLEYRNCGCRSTLAKEVG